MITPGNARPLLRVWLALLLAAPSGFSQVAQVPQVAPVPKAAPGQPPSLALAGAALTVVILEGKNAVNSLPLLRSNAPIVEVRDQNDFPVEGAAVVFALPGEGAGGTFPGGEKTFTTRTDSHGQAAAPLFTPLLAGKFEIKVTATAGNRKGDVAVSQTNSTGEYSGPPVPPKPAYKKRLPLVLAGVAGAAAIVAVVLLTHKSTSASTAATNPSTITITPGSPIFH